MSNALVSIDMVAREALRIAHEKATFIGTVNRSYDDSFAKSGGKIGDTLRIRNPNQYVRTQGSRVMSVQDQAESTQTIVVATQDHVDMRWNSAEGSLTIDEISERYLEPAMSVLISGVDADCIIAGTKATYNVAGTAGTVVGAVTSGFSDTSALGAARAKLNQGLAPKDSQRSVQLDSITMGSVANGIKGLFNPTGQISDAFREGFVARNAMADWYENERTWTLTNGSDVTISTDAAALVVDGTAALDFHTLTAAQVTIGAVFTIAGVYACHPETKQAYSHLQQFVLLTGGATAGASTVSPTIYLTGAKKNVSKADGTNLAASDFNAQVMTFVGAASTSYRQNLMYHKDAFVFVTADLPLYDKAEKCVRRMKDGISLRVWQDADIRNDELLTRIDLLWGFATVRPAWASRITN